MNLRRSLADLLVSVGRDLPALCNVVVELNGEPIRVADRRWEIALKTPPDAPPDSPKSVLAIHDNPLPAALGLNYPATADALLTLFSDERLRSFLVPGESALVQGEPRFSSDQGRLFINVEAIILIRPWRTFGRRQIDFAAGCSRKHYLSLRKGVRANSPLQLLPTWQSLAGQVAHDLIEAAAQDLSSAHRRNDSFVRGAISSATALKLVAVGAANLSAAITGMARGLEALERLARSPALTELLQKGGPWLAETDALDLGVTLTPDLVGNQVVVELKRQSPESVSMHAGSIKAQARGYLAWAMVTYGIDQVAANWRAAVVNLHHRVPEAERIVTLKAERSEIAQRVFNRHRLIALSDGSWLPQPLESECTHCEFHKSDPDVPSMPPACQFHCQTERGWDCADLDGGIVCPLYGQCDEHRRYHKFTAVDSFNRLREDLMVEDEEGELAIKAIADDQARHWGPFQVSKLERGQIRLSPSNELKLLEGAIPGQVFEIRTGGAVLARARYRRLRDGDWLLQLDGRSGRLKPGQDVWLAATGVSAYPARDQLTELERAQRAGEPPGVLPQGGEKNNSVRVFNCELKFIPADIDTVIVDARTGHLQAEALEAVLPPTTVRTLILLGNSWDVGQLPADTIVFDEFAAHGWLMEAPGTAVEAVKTASQRLAQAKRVALPWDLLTAGVLDGWGGVFDTVIVMDAHALPKLALDRALKLRQRRLVLIGSSIAAGPATEAEQSVRSPLFSNLIQQIVDTGGALLPKGIHSIATIHLTSPVAAGLEDLVAGFSGTIPVAIHSVTSNAKAASEPLTLRITTPLAQGQAQSVKVIARLPSDSPLSYRAIRMLMRTLSPATFDALLRGGLPASGASDGTLLGRRIVVQTASTSFMIQQNELALLLPQDRAPLSLREGVSNKEEALAIVAHAKARPERRFVATSLFSAQCRAIAAAATAAKLNNLRVLIAERVSWKAQAERSELLISLAITKVEDVGRWPYSHPGHLLPLLVGDWLQIELFCSSAMAEHPIVAAANRPTPQAVSQLS